MEFKLELVVVPVSDVDRAKAFYADKMGFTVDVDHAPNEHFRVVQLTPPGSACSITIGTGLDEERAGHLPGPAPRRDRHRGRARLARRARRGRQRALPLRPRGTDARAGSEPAPTTARSSRSATRTATAGWSRKSRTTRDDRRDREPRAAVADEAAFSDLTERHRRELHVHCYRMLASFDEAEDAVQETFLRAWRSRDSFDGSSLFRAWLYRIATNVCLDMIRRSSRRLTTMQSFAEVPWLQPYPDAMLDEAAPTDDEPDAVVVERETIELAFLAALQVLPPRQRAALIARDVLGWPAVETASAARDERRRGQQRAPASAGDDAGAPAGAARRLVRRRDERRGTGAPRVVHRCPRAR